MSLIPKTKQIRSSRVRSLGNLFILNNLAERMGLESMRVLKTKEVVENTVSRISTIAASAGA
jgi:hypothetical protein